MRLISLESIFALVVLALTFPAAADAQGQIRMIECQTDDCWGGGPEDSMTPVVGLIQQRAVALSALLPADLQIEVMIVGGYDFNHRYLRGRPHRISIGVNALAELHNDWVDQFWQGGADSEEAFGATVEWCLYHEIGHALLAHAAEKQPHLANDDSNHERLADKFASLAMLMANRDGPRRANYAAQGVYAMSLPPSEEGTASAEGVRDITGRRASSRVKTARRRGVDGILGAHLPKPERAWKVKCYVWGSGNGPDPGGHAATHEGMPTTIECQKKDFNNALWELQQYVPFLPDRQLDRITHYDPASDQLVYVQ